MKVVNPSSRFSFGCGGGNSWWALIPNFTYMFSVVFVQLAGVVALVCIRFIVTGPRTDSVHVAYTVFFDR